MAFFNLADTKAEIDGIFPSVFRYTPHRRERLTLNR